MLERKPAITIDSISSYVAKMRNSVFADILNHINEEYHYWDKIKYQPCPEGTTNEDLWKMTKLKRLSAASTISFGKYKFYWNTNNRLQGYLHFLDMNIGGTLESPSQISKEDKNRFLISSLMEEAIASSQIEGAVTTRKKAKEMLRKNQKPTNKSEQMIMNNYITIQKILEIRSEPLNRQNLLSLHKLVTNNTMGIPSEEGALRVGNDIKVVDTTTGEIVHDPPGIEEVEVLLNDLFLFFNEEKRSVFIHPLVKASIIHFMIGFIHPFADGNGRTARALFYWYLLKKGYWLVEYLSISRLILRAKAQYARAYQYTEIDDLDLTYFILFSLRTMQLAFEELRLYIQRKNEEKMKLSQFVRIDGVNYKQALMLEWFYKDKSLLLTVREAEARLAVSKVAARKNLMHLVKMGFLSVVEIDKKTNGFICSEKFDSMLSGNKKDKRKPSIDKPSSSNASNPGQAKLF